MSDQNPQATNGPIPASGTGSENELKSNTRQFRPPQTIPPTIDVLAAVAAGTSETVPTFTSMQQAIANASSLAALSFGAGAESIEEMPSMASPKSPYNTVLLESEAGHLCEFDDTPSAERINILHRAGTQIEMFPDGSVKYKCAKLRQDVTLNNHEIMITGDFKIVVDGAYLLTSKKGELVIEAKDGAAINVNGKLKLTADDIELKASKHIFLNAPKVDIGGTSPGGMPMMSLPGGVVFNERWPFDPTLVPRVNIPMTAAGLSALKALNLPDTRFDRLSEPFTKLSDSVKELTKSTDEFETASAPAIERSNAIQEEDSDVGLLNFIGKIVSAITGINRVIRIIKSIGTIITRLPKILKTIPTILTMLPTLLRTLVSLAKLKPPMPSAAAMQTALKTMITKETLDAAGELAVSKLNEQPGIIPLSDPFLYKSDVPAVVRGRAFDSPEDIGNAESYNAHINLSVELEDYTQEARTSPGRAVQSDTTIPLPEPLPATALPLLSGGRARMMTDNAEVIGVNTKFTEDIIEGQTILVAAHTGVVQSIINNTSLLLTSPWSGPTAESEVQSYRFRPMSSTFGTFTYTKNSSLGSSGLTLGDMTPTLRSPVFEVPKINAAMLKFGLNTPFLDADGEADCPGADRNVENIFGTVQEVFNSCSWDFLQDEEAGKFVECVVAKAGPAWGLWRKTGGKKYNNHSVELIVYNGTVYNPPRPLYNGKHYQFVDIIVSQGSLEAKIGWGPTCPPFEDTNNNWYRVSDCPGCEGGVGAQTTTTTTTPPNQGGSTTDPDRGTSDPPLF